MSDFLILTDSSADLSAEQVRELDVHVLPLSFLMAGRNCLDTPDHADMSIESFYAQMDMGMSATTAAVNMGAYLDFLERESNGRDVLILSFSSGLSGTYQASALAAEEFSREHPGQKIYAVDTLSASLGQGLLVYYAAKLRESGKSIDEVRTWVEENKLRLCHWFTVDDLIYLRRGGRVSTATAVVGTMLQIKPVMHMDNAGHLMLAEKARGRKASLHAMIEHMAASADDPGEQVVFISHGAAREDAERVAEEVRSRFGTKEIVIGNIGPVIGAHTGPGVVALFFLGNAR